MKSSKISFIKQLLNIPALREIRNTVKNPSLLIPHISVNSINEVDFHRLKEEHQVKYIVFDKDNTLSFVYQDDIHHSIQSKINLCKDMFHGNIAILSNSVGSCDDPFYEGAKKTEASMNIPVIRHQIKKPGCLQDVLTYFESKTNTVVLPQHVCMIGDRLFTDVLFANSNGMISIFVAPIHPWKDHPIAILIRNIERYIILPLIKRLGYHAKPPRT